MEREHLARPRLRGFARKGAKRRTTNRADLMCGVYAPFLVTFEGAGQARCLRSNYSLRLLERNPIALERKLIVFF